MVTMGPYNGLLGGHNSTPTTNTSPNWGSQPPAKHRPRIVGFSTFLFMQHIYWSQQ